MSDYTILDDGTSGGAAQEVWAFGAVAVEMLGGQPLFPGGSMRDLPAAITRFDPATLRARLPGVPEPLLHLIARCLSRDPAPWTISRYDRS